MRLRNNIIASYASQIYVVAIGIVMMPIYVELMGAEAYGLVGFFALLQAWLQLLDFGLTPTMARESARAHSGEGNASGLRQLLRLFEFLFWGIGLVASAVLITFSREIAENWLNASNIALRDVQAAIVLMAVAVCFRWVSGLYRGTIQGLEKLVWLGGFNMAIATGRFVLVVPVLLFAGSEVEVFFFYQASLAFVELVALATKSYSALPESAAIDPLRWSLSPLRRVWKLSLGIAFSGSVWIVVTHLDKLLLSYFLPLADYGLFTLAVMLASGVLLLSGPISSAVLPRLTRITAEGDHARALQLYREATQLVGVVAVPTALVLAYFAEEVLFVWTGNGEIARECASVLPLYAIGNALLAFSGFPYYLQYARGDVRLHILGMAIFALMLVPTMIGLVVKYGMVGAGYAWVCLNAAYFLLWVPRVHRRLAPGVHSRWLFEDIGPIVAGNLACATIVHRVVRIDVDRARGAFDLMVIASVLFAVAAICSSRIRKPWGSWWQRNE